MKSHLRVIVGGFLALNYDHFAFMDEALLFKRGWLEPALADFRVFFPALRLLWGMELLRTPPTIDCL